MKQDSHLEPQGILHFCRGSVNRMQRNELPVAVTACSLAQMFSKTSLHPAAFHLDC